MQAFDNSIRDRYFWTGDSVSAVAPACGGTRLGGRVQPGAYSVQGRTWSCTLSIVLFVMACLGILLGGPSVCRAATSVAIGGAAYDEPGVSGPGWEWRDASTLVLSGYNGPTISIEGGVTLVLEGANTATFDPGAFGADSDLYSFYTGIECFGDLTVRGSGSLAAVGDQAGILVMGGALSVEGCAVDAKARGGEATNAVCAGVLADALRVTDGAKLTAFSAADLGAGSYGVCVGLNAAGGGAAGQAGGTTISASTVDATGQTGGFVVTRDIVLEGVGVTVPQGGSVGAVTVVGAPGARGVIDAAGVLAPHAVIAPGESGGTGGGDTGGTGDGGGAGGGTGGSGSATEPTTPGGGTGSGDTGSGAGAGTGSGARPGCPEEKPTAGEPKPSNKTPKPTPAAADTPANQAPRQTAKLTSTNGPLPTTGEFPLHIALMIPASAAFFAYSCFKAREADR